MKEELASLLREALGAVARDRGLHLEDDVTIQVDVCRDEKFVDFSSNLAMEFASRMGADRMSPRDLGQAIVDALPPGDGLVERAELAGPGFLNFFIRRERWLEELRGVLLQGDRYGCSDLGRGERVQVEFVSANPTGPLHLGHGRGAAVGDILAGVLRAVGYEVEKEFYINDAGRQVELLARSVLARCRELLGKTPDFPEDGYRGDYIYDLAKEAILKKGESLLSDPEEGLLSFLQVFAIDIQIAVIVSSINLCIR